MILIRAIKFEINTSSGLFGGNYFFKKGLNIVKGNNTSGKSTLFQSILYCLGFEELLGGKNEKTMQAVLRDTVEFPNPNTPHKVLQSCIFLEISNNKNEIITIKRSVTSSTKSSKLVEIFYGSLITDNTENLNSQPMYVHDKGSATDKTFGFHQFLEKFIGWKLPYIINKTGDKKKLYLQQIASAFIIEQKAGWSRLFATMPLYDLSNKEARVIEFLLRLDVYESSKLKQQVTIEKNILENNWTNLYKQFVKLAEKGGGTLNGLSHKPYIINDITEISIVILDNKNRYSIPEYIELLNDQLLRIETHVIPKISERIKEYETEIDELNQEINTISLKYEMLFDELGFDKDNLNRYREQLISLEDDLRKNKGALKVKKLGAEALNINTAKDRCPTCDQPIRDSLLPENINQTPMLIEDNIEFIESQIKMIKAYIEGEVYKITEKEKNLEYLKNVLSAKRHNLRNLKKTLVQDERLPSEIEIEKKINIRRSIEFYTKYLDEFNDLIDNLQNLSGEYKIILTEVNNLPKEYFSSMDKSKISYLLEQFKRLLGDFNFTSTSKEFIHLSDDNYLPLAERNYGNERKLKSDLKYDCSASDFIRCIWAYICSLYLVSEKYPTNHPKILIFDEPKQQDISVEHFRNFLVELSQYKNAQTILFASFENSDNTYNSITGDIEFNLVPITKKLIKPIATSV